MAKQLNSPSAAALGAAQALGLPTERKPPMLDLQKYTILVYGREKIGKTTLFSSFPDALFLSTEPGTKALEIFEYNHEQGGCRNWTDMLTALAALEAAPGRFATVVVDTADRAYDFCLDYVCGKKGVSHPSEKNDYGATWNDVRKEFLNFIHRIERTGRGICFTSHLRELDIKLRGHTITTKIIPSMTNQARGVVEAVVDLFFYAEYIRLRNGDIVRVLVTQGNEYIWGGGRKGPGKMPLFVPLLEEGGYDLLKRAFQGEAVGIDPKDVLPAVGASEPAKRAISTISSEL